MSQSSLPEKANRSVITDWRPEDPEFWQQRGKSCGKPQFMDLRSLSVTGVLRLDVVQRGCR